MSVCAKWTLPQDTTWQQLPLKPNLHLECSIPFNEILRKESISSWIWVTYCNSLIGTRPSIACVLSKLLQTTLIYVWRRLRKCLSNRNNSKQNKKFTRRDNDDMFSFELGRSRRDCINKIFRSVHSLYCQESSFYNSSTNEISLIWIGCHFHRTVLLIANRLQLIRHARVRLILPDQKVLQHTLQYYTIHCTIFLDTLYYSTIRIIRLHMFPNQRQYDSNSDLTAMTGQLSSVTNTMENPIYQFHVLSSTTQVHWCKIHPRVTCSAAIVTNPDLESGRICQLEPDRSRILVFVSDLGPKI